MTQAQQRMVNRIRREAENMHSSSDYEIKEWDVQDTDWGTVIIYVEVGLVNDEGTMAQCLCRDRVQLFIGPKGGTKFPVHRCKKDGTIHNFYKSYTNIWSATYEYDKH